MAVNAAGDAAGALPATIEPEVKRIAQQVLRGAPPQLVQFSERGGAAVAEGLPCKQIEVWVQRHEPSRFTELALTGGRAAEVTLLGGAAPGAKLLVEANGARSGSLGAPELDDEAERVAAELIWQEISERRGTMFVDVLVPPPRLLVFGAGEIATGLCGVGRAAGWRVFVIDPSPGAGVEAEDVVAGPLVGAVAQCGGIDPATSILVLTHDHELGTAALSLALHSPARFIGAMGSRRTQAIRRERLLDAGFEPTELERISAPVGLDLGAVEPAETALSILAEVVAARHGRSGGRIADRGGAVHAPEAVA